MRVTGMHYEARIQCVRDWHRERKIWMTKADCRETLVAPWQYLQVFAFPFIDFRIADASKMHT